MNIHTTLAEREKTHGSFMSHAELSQRLKNSLKDRQTAWLELYDWQREALEMICHKMARIINGNPNEADHWHDISGYATLVADRLMPTSKRGNNCDCEVCKESASTITGQDACKEDIKI